MSFAFISALSAFSEWTFFLRCSSSLILKVPTTSRAINSSWITFAISSGTSIVRNPSSPALILWYVLIACTLWAEHWLLCFLLGYEHFVYLLIFRRWIVSLGVHSRGYSLYGCVNNSRNSCMRNRCVYTNYIDLFSHSEVEVVIDMHLGLGLTWGVKWRTSILISPSLHFTGKT